MRPDLLDPYIFVGAAGVSDGEMRPSEKVRCAGLARVAALAPSVAPDAEFVRQSCL